MTTVIETPAGLIEIPSEVSTEEAVIALGIIGGGAGLASQTIASQKFNQGNIDEVPIEQLLIAGGIPLAGGIAGAMLLPGELELPQF